MSGHGFVVNAEAAVYRDGEYLLAERAAAEDHAAGMLSLVGGTVEPDVVDADTGGPPLRETVRREVREEVGVEVGETEYVTSSAFESDTGTRVVNVVFLARYLEGEARPREPEEVAAVRWRPIGTVREDDDVPSFTLAYVERADERRRELGW